MKKKGISLALIPLILFLFSDISLPWGEEAHTRMSKEAISISVLPEFCQNNLGYLFSVKRFFGPVHSKTPFNLDEFANDENYTATGWMIHGGGSEDEFFTLWKHLVYLTEKDIRANNHFYNPFWDNRNIYPYPNDAWGNSWLNQEGGLYDNLGGRRGRRD